MYHKHECNPRDYVVKGNIYICKKCAKDITIEVIKSRKRKMVCPICLKEFYRYFSRNIYCQSCYSTYPDSYNRLKARYKIITRAYTKKNNQIK